MTDERHYWVYSPDRIRLSPTARVWAKEHKMSERDFAKYLIARHMESDEPFAEDVGIPAGRDSIRGLEPEALFAGDVGSAAGRDERTGFAPQVLAETASELLDPFARDVGSPAGRKDIEGFRPESERQRRARTSAPADAQRIHDAESYWGTKW
jgi:hypothetical protein